MGVTSQILINKPADGVHKAGRTVSGRVRYSIDKPYECSTIFVSLVEKGTCHVFKLKLSFNENSVGYYDISHDSKLLKCESQEKPILLPIGTYEHDFSFMIPKTCPHPYKDKHCSLTYRIELSFENESLFGSKYFYAPLSVLTYVTPEHPEGKVPFEMQKTLYYKNQTIKIKGEISNTFLTPGQTADIFFDVTNDTDTIHTIETKLVCYTTYQNNCGQSKELMVTIKESTDQTPTVPANDVVKLSSKLHVPEHLFSLQNCKLIKKQYKVRVSVPPHTNPYTEIPVVIGHKYDGETTEEISTVNENVESSHKSFTLEKTLLKLFSRKVHTIKLKVEIPNTLKSGQAADLHFFVTNDTDTLIYSVESKLVKYVTLSADEVARYELLESKVETTGVPANSNANLSCLMPVPTDENTRLYRATFKIEYKVRVAVRLYFPYKDACAEFPVFIADADKNATRVVDKTSKKQDDTYNKSMKSLGESDVENSGPKPAAEVREPYENGPAPHWEVMSNDSCCII